MSYSLAVTTAKFASFIIQTFRLGSGATWPGEIALLLHRSILSDFFREAESVVLIAGTNGKTTTSKMLDTILIADHKKSVRNSSGANLDNGIISTFIRHTTKRGALKKATFIFEVDEATLPHILRQGTPRAIILMNLFRDQLDRYGEVDMIIEKWSEAFLTYGNKKNATEHRKKEPVLNSLPYKQSPTFIINADDPHLAFIGQQLEERGVSVYYFGLNNPELFLRSMQHATDSIFCPKCGNRLTFGGVYFSHLGKYACGQCGFTHPQISLSAKDVHSPLEGVYNIYNTLAAQLTARFFGISNEQSSTYIQHFRPAFGRMETVLFQGKKAQILLSKNPTGFNESIRTMLVSKKKGPLLCILNDRIPDGRDISWIYDVDFEPLWELDTYIIIAGDRAYDLAVRLKYAGIDEKNMKVFEGLEDAVFSAFQHVKDEEQLWILATYSGMLDVRKIITGRKIL